MRTLATLLVLLAAALPAAAQGAPNWPTRPVTMVVPFTAGTTSDVVGRALAEELTKALGQSFVVENRGGAGGNLGAGVVAKAAPDGYTLLVATTGPAATNQFMYESMSFDPQRDFKPVVLLGKAPIVVVTRPDLPLNTLKDALDRAAAAPEKTTVGFPGNGALGHVTGILLQRRAGVRFGQVQYRGSAQIITDLLGGHIDLGMDSIAAYVPLVQDGKLRALAIASAARWPQLPDVPTVSEAGLAGFEASVWYALLAPAGTPDAVVSKLNAAANAFLARPAARDALLGLGIVPAGGTPEDLKAFTAAEIEKWSAIIKEAGIKF
jgi:tripartite-type tricarboxylate transporter receptor subunit TctC